MHSTERRFGLSLGEVGLLADELRGLHLGTLHAGFDDGALGIELEAEGPVALLDAPGRAVDADADGDGAVVLPGSEYDVPQLRGLVHRHVELPAELADVGDPGGEHGAVHALDGDLATGEEAEAAVGHVVAAEPGEDVAGARSPEADGGELVGAVAAARHLDQVVGEPLPVGHAVGTAGDDPEVVVAEPHHGEVGEEPALGVEDRGVDDLADGDVALGDAGLLHRRERARAGDVEDAERGQVDHAGVLAHGEVLGVDDRAPPAGVPLVLARHHCSAVLLDEAGVGLVPPRPLPADGLVEPRPERLLRLRHRRPADAAVGLVLLVGVDDAVGLDERLARAGTDVLTLGLVGVEPGDVAVADVDLGVAVGHPLRHRATHARGPP